MWLAIFALIKDVVVPEIATFIRERAAANNGQIPTDEEIIAKFQADWRASAARGQAFLDASAPKS